MDVGIKSKKKAKHFCIEYQFRDSSKTNIKKVIEQLGYTIIEFNYIFNDEDIQNLIDALKISDDLIRSRGFTYANTNQRIVFVNEDFRMKKSELFWRMNLATFIVSTLDMGQ